MSCSILHTQVSTMRGRHITFSASVSSQSRMFRNNLTPRITVSPFQRPGGAQPRVSVGVSRTAMMVVAADDKEKKKRKPKTSVEIRERVSEQNRMYNKARKTGVSNRIKKVIKLADEIKAKVQNVQSEEDLALLTQLISDAYSSIDKAVSKGVYHKNTAARKKARVAKYRRSILIAAGLYTPEAVASS